MARTGRPPTPTETKRKLGTLRADRMPGGMQLAVVAACEPTMADQSPLSAFDSVMAMGVAWLAQTDAPSLALLRDLLEERDGLKRALADGVGDRKHLRDLDKQIIELLSTLGFNPAARSRLGLAEVKAASKLEGIRASQAKRAPVGN
jgi:hypothetical protein